MPRQLLPAADIRRLGREQKSDLLFLSPEEIVIPEAMDVARELGVQLVREKPGGPISAGSSQPTARSPDGMPLPALKMVFGDGVIMDPFDEGLTAPSMNVRLMDVTIRRIVLRRRQVTKRSNRASSYGRCPTMKWTLCSRASW